MVRGRGIWGRHAGRMAIGQARRDSPPERTSLVRHVAGDELARVRPGPREQIRDTRPIRAGTRRADFWPAGCRRRRRHLVFVFAHDRDRFADLGVDRMGMANVMRSASIVLWLFVAVAAIDLFAANRWLIRCAKRRGRRTVGRLPDPRGPRQGLSVPSPDHLRPR